MLLQVINNSLIASEHGAFCCPLSLRRSAIFFNGACWSLACITKSTKKKGSSVHMCKRSDVVERGSLGLPQK